MPRSMNFPPYKTTTCLAFPSAEYPFILFSLRHKSTSCEKTAQEVLSFSRLLLAGLFHTL